MPYPLVKDLLPPAVVLRSNPRRNPPQGGRAQKVIAVLEKSEMKAPPRGIMTPGELVYFSLQDYIGKRANEVFLAIYLNVYNVMVGFSEYTSGSAAEVSVNPIGIFKDALLANAAGIITVHQHPAGNARPSDADERMWLRLRRLGELLELPVVDNLVLGEDEFFSETDNRRISYAKLKIMMPA